MIDVYRHGNPVEQDDDPQESPGRVLFTAVVEAEWSHRTWADLTADERAKYEQFARAVLQGCSEQAARP